MEKDFGLLFAKRIVELRMEKGVTQMQIVKATGLANSTIANYELGKRTPSMYGLIKLAEYFDCSIDYLVGLVDD
jgi:transcriptional regulator with XRE-family HTH domain